MIIIFTSSLSVEFISLLKNVKNIYGIILCITGVFVNLLHLGLIASLSTVSHSFAQVEVDADPFDVFMDELTPSYDIKLNTFEYDRINEVNGHRGSFSFTNFNVVNSSISTKLNNENGIFNADIYMLNGRFGFINENFKFAYKLNDTDFDYIDSIKFGSLLNTHFIMNRSEIFMDSEAIEFREPRTYVKAHNYKLNCDRHPEYLLNDGQGLMAGCFNFGSLIPSGQPGIDFNLKFYTENEEKIVDVTSYIESLKTSQEDINIKGLSLSGLFNETTKIELGDYSFHCSKNGDVLSISGEDLVEPCLSNLDMKSPELKLTLLDEGNFMEIKDIDLIVEREIVNIKANRFNFSSLKSVFNIGNFELKCDLIEGEVTDIATYMTSCLSSSELTTVSKSDFFFNQTGISEKTGKPLDLKIDGTISNLKIQDGRLILGADEIGLNVSDKVFFDFKDIAINCRKNEEHTKLEIPLLLETCKKDISVEAANILLHMINEKTESIRGQIKSRYIFVENNKLNLNIDTIKIIDKESRRVLKGILGHCKLKEDTDVLDVSSVIEACSRNLALNISSLFTRDEGTSQATLKDNRFDINNFSVEEEKAGVSDIRASIVNGQLAASMRVRVMGMNPLVTLQGEVDWNAETEYLTLDISHSKLPLGITSKGMFMSIAKKFLASDRIQFGDNNKIMIKL